MVEQVSEDQPVCRWCRQTEAKHLPPSQSGRPKARTPCLLWRENFVPRTSSATQLPASTPSSALTKEQRLAVVREIWEYIRETNQVDGFRALYSFERSVMEKP